MKTKLYIITTILFLFKILFLSQALGAEEELVVNFNPDKDSQSVVRGDEFSAQFTFSGTADKLVKTIEFGAILSAYYDENFGGQSADFVTRVTINGKSIVWTGTPFYEAPTSSPEPDHYISDPKIVFDELGENIILSPGNIIYLKIGIGSNQGMGVIYKDKNEKDNYLKLILDEPPVTCNVRADFVLNNDPSKTTAVIGEEITFTNKSTGDGVDSATWEWSFEKSPDNRTFPEDIKNEREPSITFNKEGNYTVKLVASGKEGEADCTSYRTIDFEVKCGVKANFTASAISISKGKTIKFTNTSTGVSVTDGSAVWEWSFKYPLNTIFPETLKNEKSPELTFENMGQYIINLKASMPGDLCSTNKNIAIEVIDTNLSHAIKGLKVLAGIDDTLSETDIELTDLNKDKKITLEDVISILKKIAGQ